MNNNEFYKHISNDLLEEACKKNDLEFIKLLITRIDKNNSMLLTYACTHNKFNIIKYLVSLGYDKDKDYAMNQAGFSGNLPLVKYLISIGAKPSGHNNYAFIWACRNGHLDTIKYLISVGCKPIDTAINWASRFNHPEIVKYLVLIGCDISKIKNPKMKNKAIKWLHEYKQEIKN